MLLEVVWTKLCFAFFSKLNLDLNYLLIAKAAVFCSAHFSSLLYTELWCQEKISESGSKKLHSGTFEHGYSLLDLIYESESLEITNVLQQILQVVSYRCCNVNILQLQFIVVVQIYWRTGRLVGVRYFSAITSRTQS